MAPPPAATVFLSYASDDRELATRVAGDLREAGLEVWFDRDELRGGDAWDARIRERIRTCTFFVALVTEATERRAEGYFRREWRLAVERSHDMAEDRPFLLPVAAGDFDEQAARVPERFREVQWQRLGADGSAAALGARLHQLHARLAAPPPSTGRSRTPFTGTAPAAAAAPARAGRWPLVAAAVVLLAVAGWFGWTRWKAPAVDGNSVAVLPFTNLSGEPASEYFSDGLTEELLNTLGQNPLLRIVARTSCFAFKGRNLPAPEIGRQLRVATLIEGTVRREGDEVVLTLKLIDAARGYGRWSTTVREKMSAIFSAQAKIAQAITAQLLPGTILASAVPPTSNLDAYDAFLRGRSFEVKAPSRNSLTEAVTHFRRATELDPSYAQAWAHYGLALVHAAVLGFDDNDDSLARARQAIETALRLQPALPAAHHALANLHTVNWTNDAIAQRELLLAAQAQPSNAGILLDLASTHLNLGQFPQAVETIRRATRLDPQNAEIANFAGVVFDRASLYAESLAERERAFRLSGWTTAIAAKAATYRNWKGDLALALRTLETVRPTETSDDADAGFYWWTKSTFLAAMGNFEGATEAAARMPEITPTPFFYHSREFHFARIREAAGDAAGARTHYERALVIAERYQRDTPRKVRAHTQLALIYSGLGRHPEAWASAQKAVEIVPPSENPYVAARAGLRVMAQVAARSGRMEEALKIVRDQVAAGFWRRHDLLLDDDWRVLRRDADFMKIAQAAPL